MNLILPNYLLTRKNFKCSRCSFAFYKQTPSRVEKCPKCSKAVYDTTYKKGDYLDTYSASKLRWYEEESGERHAEEILHRKVKKINGKSVTVNTDSKGREIDIMPTYDVTGTAMGTKRAEGRI